MILIGPPLSSTFPLAAAATLDTFVKSLLLAFWLKLLYRKVFFFNQSEVQTIGNSFNHNIVGIDEVVSCYGHAISNAGDDFISRWLPFAYTLGTDSLPAWYGAVMAGKNTVKIQLGSSMLSYLTRLYIIIEYTKL
jgi:hypothetical protein